MHNLLIMGVTSYIPEVDVDAADDSVSFTQPAPCFASFQLDSDGYIYHNSVYSSATADDQRSLWLLDGEAVDVWVEYTLNSGSLNNNDPGAGRLNLGTDRLWSVIDSINDANPQTADFDLNFYDAASGGSLIGGPFYVTLSASRT